MSNATAYAAYMDLLDSEERLTKQLAVSEAQLAEAQQKNSEWEHLWQHEHSMLEGTMHELGQAVLSCIDEKKQLATSEAENERLRGEWTEVTTRLRRAEDMRDGYKQELGEVGYQLAQAQHIIRTNHPNVGEAEPVMFEFEWLFPERPPSTNAKTIVFLVAQYKVVRDQLCQARAMSAAWKAAARWWRFATLAGAHKMFVNIYRVARILFPWPREKA